VHTSIEDLAVYLVEPSPTQFTVISRQLAMIGVNRIQQFESGAKALAAMCEATPSVVISSFYLPDMQGTELIQTMRDDADLERIPFILISSETRPQVLDPIRQSGACAILPKPFTTAQLQGALRASLDLLNPEGELNADIDLDSFRVMIVDDSNTARRYIRQVLENLGIENFVEAGNGKEAVALLAETMVDLVVTDYNMPEMDGKELVHYIRTQSWQNSVPILMVTSEGDAGRLAAVEQAGVSAICDKPFEPRTVRRLIEQALASN
jgi:two-component system chemotaxis response regulator CheY